MPLEYLSVLESPNKHGKLHTIILGEWVNAFVLNQPQEDSQQYRNMLADSLVELSAAVREYGLYPNKVKQ
jgi:hypothetical protein